MIYTITFNASLDYVAYTDNTESGMIHKISDYEVYPGGKGINVSQILHNLDVPSVAWGYVAGVTGEILVKLLDNIGIKQDFICLDEGITRINVKLRSHGAGEIIETDFNGTGPVIDRDKIDALKEKMESLTNNDTVVISGSIPASISTEVFDELLTVTDNKGSRLIVDTTGEYLEVALTHKPFLIKPNEDEVKEFFSISNINSKEEIVRCAKSLQQMGARNVLISLGENGAHLLTDNGKEYTIMPPAGEVVNTVGAGDSMVAGFVAGYLKNENYKEALELAVCAGSATAFSKGLATKEVIKVTIDGFYR